MPKEEDGQNKLKLKGNFKTGVLNFG
jgi:hypothetical protein